MDFEEDGVVSTTAAAAVLLPLHPSLPERGGGGGVQLRDTSSLLHIPEGRPLPFWILWN